MMEAGYVNEQLIIFANNKNMITGKMRYCEKRRRNRNKLHCDCKNAPLSST